MTGEMFAALCTFPVVNAMTPGPNNAMLLTAGVNFGLRRTVPHLVGVIGGFAFMTFAVGIGLQGAFAAAPALYTAIRWGGAAYLLYLAWRIALSGGVAAGTAPKPLTFWQAAAFQWVNPKAWMMAVTAIATFSTPATARTDLLIVVAAFCILNTPAALTWASAGLAVRRLLDRPRALRIFNVTMAALLVASLYPLAGELWRMVAPTP